MARRHFHSWVNTEIMPVTAYCRKCNDMVTIEAEFLNGALLNIVPTRHFILYGNGPNKCIYHDCGGEVRLYIPSKIRMY